MGDVDPISAGGLLAGVVGKIRPPWAAFDSQIESAVANQQAQGHLDAVSATNKANADLQREFAQMGIRWRVEDARAAGLHPLAALGMSPASASPSFVVGNSDFTAAARNSTEGDVMANLASALMLQRGFLENELLSSQIAKLRQDNGSKPVPELEPVPHAPVLGSKHNAAMDAGAINSGAYVKLPNGNVTIAPSKDMKERMEDDPIQENLWHAMMRSGDVPAPPVSMLPDGGAHTYWEWVPALQQFRVRRVEGTPTPPPSPTGTPTLVPTRTPSGRR